MKIENNNITVINLVIHYIFIVLFMSAITACSTPAILRADNLLRDATPGKFIKMQLSAGESRIGDSIAIDISAPTGGFVYLFQIKANNKNIDKLFPSTVDVNNFLKGGTTMTLPRPTWRISINGPAGLDYFFVLVTKDLQNIKTLEESLKNGQIIVSGPYGGAMATLREYEFDHNTKGK